MLKENMCHSGGFQSDGPIQAHFSFLTGQSVQGLSMEKLNVSQKTQ